jgi:hypothetical protein
LLSILTLAYFAPVPGEYAASYQVGLGVGISPTQQAIEHEAADLSLISHVPQARLTQLQADPEQARPAESRSRRP